MADFKKLKANQIEILAAEVPYDNTASGLTATNVKTAIDEVVAATVDETFRQVTYAASVTDTYDGTQPNFYINLTGDITLAIGTITQGSGVVNLIRDNNTRTITLTGEVEGNHTYSTTDLTIRLAYNYENGDVVWYCLNPDTAAGGGDVTKVGTPANNQVGVWTGDGTIEGATNLTWDDLSFTINSTTGGTRNLELTNSAGTYSEILFGSTNVDTGKIGGLSYRDNAGSTRLAFYFNNNQVVLSNRALNGTVQIRANAAAGSGGEVIVLTANDDLLDINVATDINGQLDVTGNIVVSGTVDGIDLGTTIPLKANLASPTFTGTVVIPSTFTIGANNFVRSGAHSLTLTTTATSNITLPTTGTVVTQAGTSTLTNKTITNAVNTVTTPGVNSIGYLGVPQNSKSAAYTLVLTDAGKHILHPSADTTARTFTIPSNASVAFPIGTAVSFINQNAGGVITIAITTDTMRLAGAGTTGSRTLAANGIATAIKTTATTWLISGTNLT